MLVSNIFSILAWWRFLNRYLARCSSSPFNGLFSFFHDLSISERTRFFVPCQQILHCLPFFSLSVTWLWSFSGWWLLILDLFTLLHSLFSYFVFFCPSQQLIHLVLSLCTFWPLSLMFIICSIISSSHLWSFISRLLSNWWSIVLLILIITPV